VESVISGLGYESSISDYNNRTIGFAARRSILDAQALTVRDSSRGAQALVAVKYLKQDPLDDRSARHILSQYNRSQLPLLIVTNSRFTKTALYDLTFFTHAENQVPAKSVQWHDDADNAALRDALADLFGSIPSTRTGNVS
jgi:hypothetical protein